jgi:phosphoribosylformimino-5-aminoimidazole carboxamide ribonucleotide (ProFAR) isomerase
MQDLGCQRVIFTDVSTDGTLQGPNVEATRKMVEQLSIPVIASGGVSSLEDLDRLAESGVEGAIVGKALYEGRFTVSEALSAIAR